MKIYYNKLKYLTLAFGVCFLFVSGCSDDDTIVTTPTTPANTGTANFTMYVSIGNSLTAGYQSSALSQRDQVWSFPSQIANQVANLTVAKNNANATFEQPLIKDPGIGGRLRLVNLAPTIVSEGQVDPTSPASNLNIALQRPYNNLGIPGAILYDMADVSDFSSKSASRQNPFFALVLRDQALGNSVLRQARNLQASFITAWIGNNDVLGYATSGGTKGTNVGYIDPPGTTPTETAVFSSLYSAMLDSLKAESRGVIVGNIPDVASVPFFTTVGPLLAAKVPWDQIAAGQQGSGLPGSGIIYESKTGFQFSPFLPNNKVRIADSAACKNLTTLFTLAGQTYAGLIGVPTGQFYRDNNFSGLPPGIDTTKPFGVHPQNPFPDVFVLDPAEITVSKDAVTAFNSIIATEAGSRNIAVVDFNLVLKNLLTNPIVYPGIGVFTSNFISGGTFSYDGVHPSSRGYGIIANEWIKAINTKFSANIPLVDLNSLPGMPIGKVPAKEINYEPKVFNDMIRMMTGNKNWPVRY